MYRDILNQAPFFLFIVALFIFCVTGIVNIFFLFFPLSQKDKEAAKKYPRVFYGVPLFWFLASIPEGIGYFMMPIYTMGIFSSFGFLLVILSDWRNERIVFTAKTGVFVVSTILAIIFAALSL